MSMVLNPPPSAVHGAETPPPQLSMLSMLSMVLKHPPPQLSMLSMVLKHPPPQLSMVLKHPPPQLSMLHLDTQGEAEKREEGGGETAIKVLSRVPGFTRFAVATDK
ncbi:hypothetical protein NHX12_034219, partial [Muraenolepis orangiensis]